MYKIGVDGGGTKTEAILVDPAGQVVARQLAPGCNPSVVGFEQAKLILTDTLCALLAQVKAERPGAQISETRLYMAGSPPFWREVGDTLGDFGRVSTAPDSLPVLELATAGGPGMVLHSGTGSFIAARDPDGRVHYAGGLGWRFGDGGSAYDIGRRAISRALLELQGWVTASRLATTVRDHAQLPADADARAVARVFYGDHAVNQRIAALAPAVLRLANEGDRSAHQLILESTSELVDLAGRVFATLFSGVPADALRAGLSGRILTHPVVQELLARRSPLPLVPITDPPIEGVRRLLAQR